MEWWDDKGLQWSRLPHCTLRQGPVLKFKKGPARYHRDYRAELIALAAQQPGAPGDLSSPPCQVEADRSSLD